MSGTITVATEADLNQAIATVDAATSGSYTIAFSATITEGTDAGQSSVFNSTTIADPADLFALNVAAGVNVTLDGGGFALDGAGAERGLFVYAGSVAIENLTIQNTLARGGNGGNGGGGGAGLGGGLFVAGTNGTLSSGGVVTLAGVTFTNDAAQGGTGGIASGGGGGGGGLGGDGGSASEGGGGVGIAATGVSSSSTGSPGIVLGAGSGGGNGSASNTGGPYGGGGVGDGGGGVNGQPVTNGLNGAAGGFGGGGGSSYGATGTAGAGGFGGGGGESGSRRGGAQGGFGGGGGGGYPGGYRGFGGGFGSSVPYPQSTTGGGGGGGGGLGAGGDIFLQAGAVLTIGAGTLHDGTVTEGAKGSGTATAGSAYGSGLFLQGDETITLAPGTGNSLEIAGVIADQSGSGGATRSGNAGAGGLMVHNGTVSLSALNTYTGGTTIEANSALLLGQTGAGGSGAIVFSGSNAELGLASGVTLANTIGTLRFGDVIDVGGINGGSASFDSNTSQLTISGAGGSVALTLDSAGYAPSSFSAAPDATGTGTAVTYTACFAAGTRIATARGPVAVEALRFGDQITTASGGQRPVVWLGFRSVRCRRHPEPATVSPVRIARAAFGPGLPLRDLVLSPDHAVFLGGALIPVRYLLNGASVRQEAAEEVTYFHIELDRHDILLAEGIAAESYLDTGNRSAFANGGPASQMHPDFARTAARAIWDGHACAPLAVGGDAVRTLRARLLARLPGLGFTVTTDPDLRLSAGGVPLAPEIDGPRLRVTIPPGATLLRLLSRTVRAAESDADSDDWRTLGVCLVGIEVDGAALALDDSRLRTGWHDAEPHLRWTRGDATIAVTGGSVVTLRVWRGIGYHISPATGAELAAMAA